MSETSKIALITGASRGLGRAMAIALARQGVSIIGTYHSNKTEAEATVEAVKAEGGKAVMLQLDTGKVTSFADFATKLSEVLKSEFGRERFDFLINNAGTGMHASIAETSEALFDEMMNIHFKGVFFLTQTMLPKIEDGGRILNLSSGLARFSLPGYAAYAAMKGGVEVLTRYLAKELGPRRIAVNTIAPGAIETDFGGGRVRDNKELNGFVANVTAMGRAGLPEDIGGAVAAILSDAGWITGQRIEVSGGMFA
ncbi:NAD(P)-dependent dehydrogenase (short-subunit alcohol dehydrogenase family) [Rhizomicrobium palustre]|uniref:NAD(P)-dependent dehydrogenase (Short-subunit alcohol dehydrogenase family) n=1 Tax=Rhizomicrobium palustre TaxID=189966 RepID=A0A846N1P5_9PROT|nr:SDR family oxidoreductase [Rhizomicrobium palustre]NIK89040.1 NAD(P)-dependent dehydrogenase (short-subunit alcohol dehydrogenase family) [Rhizomicrobium palustre]